MKSIVERIRKYVRSAGKRSRDRAQPGPMELPAERATGIRKPFEDPYAEMRKALATVMLLG